MTNSPKSNSARAKFPLAPYQNIGGQPRVQKSWRQRAHIPATKGLSTRGNDCWRNAVLQCLFHLPEFVAYLDNAHHEEECSARDESCVTCALKKVVNLYWQHPYRQSKGPGKTLRTLYQTVERTVESTKCTRDAAAKDDLMAQKQGDAYDFLSYLYTVLEGTEPESTEKMPVGYLKLEDVLSITHERQLACKRCKNVSRTTVPGDWYPGVGISVNLHQPREHLTLVEYLRHQLYIDRLEICCSNADCGAPPEHNDQTLRITKAPEVLVVQLSRSKFDGKKMSRLSNAVRFEEFLNLGELYKGADSHELPVPPQMYRLMGVVSHNGELGGGHYVASVRETNDQTFCTINDDKAISRVRYGTVTELEQPADQTTDYDPYMLFYSRM